MSVTTGERFDGQLLLPDEDGWEDARRARVYTGRVPDRHPAAVLRAGSVEDVQRGVRLAAANGWQVTVRSGGHGLYVPSLREGALLIDLGALNAIDYDEETGIVSAGPATLGGDELAPYLEERGRFFNGGHCPSVGLGGFLLNGGQGWNQRGWGWGAESVVAVDVVTADGELVRADADQNADLHWAARGAGPGFPGIVVRFHVRTRPRVGYLAHTVQLYELDDFTEVMTWLHTVHHEVPDNVELVAISFTPEDGHRRMLVVNALAFADDRAEAEGSLALFDGAPMIERAVSVERCVEVTMAELRAQQDDDSPRGARYLSDNAWLEGDVDEIVRRIRPLFVEAPSPASWTLWMSNAPMRPLPDMAFSLQTESYVCAYAIFDEPGEEERNRLWLEGSIAAASPVIAGRYIADVDPAVPEIRYLAPESRERLRRIIAARDPHGRFGSYPAGLLPTPESSDFDRLRQLGELRSVTDSEAGRPFRTEL